jgi:hypothetical protein
MSHHTITAPWDVIFAINAPARQAPTAMTRNPINWKAGICVANAFQSCYVSAFGEEWSEARHSFPLREHANITILCEKLHADSAHGEQDKLSCNTACTSSPFSKLEVDGRV